MKRSKTSDATRKTGSDGFLYYPYIYETNPKDMATEALFINGVCRLVEKLRETGAKVVVARDFDDQIVAQTGWNGSRDTPIHPVYD